MLDAISENKGKLSLSPRYIETDMYSYCYCKICNKELLRGSISELCFGCLNKEHQSYKQNYLQHLSLESTEDRLKKIEEWIFDHKISNSFIR